MIKKNYIYTIENAILSIYLFEIASSIGDALREYKLFYRAQNNKRPFYPTFKANCVMFTMQNRHFTIPIHNYNYCRVINVHGRFSFFLQYCIIRSV